MAIDTNSEVIAKLGRQARDRVASTIDVAPQERRPLAFAFVTFFAVLASYFTIRPLREAMGAGLPAGWLEGLFTVVFVVMVALVPVYGWVVSTLRRRDVLPATYVFFIINLVVFWLLLGSDPKAVSPVLASAFFVWVSVYNLFIVSLFWSLMADRFSSDEAKRLFGVIAAGRYARCLRRASLGPVVADNRRDTAPAADFGCVAWSGAFACATIALRVARCQCEPSPLRLSRRRRSPQ